MLDALKVLLLAPLMLIAALAAYFLESDGPRLPSTACVTGDDAQNPAGPAGDEVGRQELFETVEEAEAFLCVDLPEVTAPGWRARSANALRSHSLAEFEPGAFVFGEAGFKYAELFYEDEVGHLLPTIIVQPADLEQRAGIPISCFPPPSSGLGPRQDVPVSIHGVQTVFWLLTAPPRGMPSASVCWKEDGLTFFAGTTYEPGTDPVPHLLPALESMR